MTSRPPGGGTAQGELLESRRTRAWGERWALLSPATRRLVVVLGVLCVVAAGLVWFRDWSADRELRNRIALTTALGVSSSSTTPPGGEVGFFVVVRNDGARPVEVTAVEGATDRLRLSMRYDHQPRLDPGTVNAIALSVRLTCRPGRGPAELPVEIRLRRQDGGTTSRRVDLQPAALVRDVATTLCAVRPGLRDHELSGPALRAATTRGGAGG
jgi:hypothetical protein